MANEFEALERKLALEKLITDQKRFDQLVSMEQVDPMGAIWIGLHYGEPHFFAGPICDPLLKGAAEQFKLPWRLIREVIPAPQGFFWFEKPPSIYEPKTGGRPMPLRAASWTIFHLQDPTIELPLDREVGEMPVRLPIRGGGDMQTAVGIILQFYSEIEPGMIRPLGFTSWRFGRTQLEIVADEFKRIDQYDPEMDLFAVGGRDNAAVAVAFQFISQKLLSLATFANPDRTVRRRLGRQFPTTTNPAVRVVTLRSRERLAYIPPEEHHEVAWQSAWWVGGHWRMNHCMRPKGHATGDCWHQPTYIQTYVKGPDTPVPPPPINLYKVER